MKILIVYYSFEGNTKFVAETLAKELNADLLSLKPEKEIKSHGFMKFVWGGRQATMGTTPKLLPFDKNTEEYDFICIGTPVWAFTFTPPIRTFFKQTQLKDKQIALFCTHEGGKAKTLEKMETELEGNTIISKQDFIKPLKKKEQTEKNIIQWTEKLTEELNC